MIPGRRIAISVLIGSIFLMGCSDDLPSNETTAIWSYKDVRVDFETGGWQFFWGVKGEVGEPIESFLHLYAKRGGDCVRISAPEGMNRLDGLVVRSANGALSYVRLFTEPTTFMAFDSPGGIEIEGGETIQHDGFNIVRVLVLAKKVDGKGHPVIRTKERVSTDGKYTLVAREVLKYVSSKEAGLPVLE